MSAHPDTQHTDATADAPPVSAAPVPAEGLPPFSSAGATVRRAASANAQTGSTPSAPRSPRRKGQIANPAKGAVNPHFKSQYADLSAGLNAIRAALSANGIAIVQTTSMAMTTR